jgi:penicillin-binding protein 1C
VKKPADISIRNMHPGVRRALLLLSLASLFALFLYFSLDSPLFRDPCSTVILDRENDLLGAKIADDHQWRFPESDRVPEKFRQAILEYEDRGFLFHPGFNPYALLRAAWLNVKNRRIVSGGSTLTMQVIRLSRKNQPRTVVEKITEIFLACRFELTYSKREILALYTSHAPFGGNVVGLEAAAWRYFGVSPDQLSWGATATLAVLPNSPGLIYPGRNQQRLKDKRDRLLDRLFQRGIMDASTCLLAKSEPLPGKPLPLPQWAPHLLARAIRDGHKEDRVVTTLDGDLQRRTGEILEGHRPFWNANGIWNAAVIVVSTGVNNQNTKRTSGNEPPPQTLVAHGNISSQDGLPHGQEVDLTLAPRSTGSILKPFLYAAMLNDGLILPGTLIPDIPTQIGGFVPENFNLTYDGAVPANEALARSLNIPAVKMLQTYTYQQFHSLLKRIGMTTLTKPAGHYGLSIILGGAEARLWDITGIYASMARSLTSISREKTTVSEGYPLVYSADAGLNSTTFRNRLPFDPGSLWLTFEAMQEATRPGDEMMWRQFTGSRRIAWKTGTSFGNRDAWVIGVTPEYVVGVWVGNASGEGRPGLTGIAMAAPVMFEIFGLLPPTSWFEMPEETMIRVPLCRYSGYRASPVCEPVDSAWIPKAGARTLPCPFHQIVHLDSTGQWQVTDECESPSAMQHVAWFVLPPVQEWYFRNRNPFYKVLPPFRAGCQSRSDRRNLEMIYPKNNTVLYIPTELDGRAGSSVFRAAHRDITAKVHWHLDDRYLASTIKVHQMSIQAMKGNHRLTLTDDNGESVSVVFEVISDKKESRPDFQ